MANMTISDVRPFIPAKDFELSKAFYVALGWTIKWSDDDLALLETNDYRFYLQRHYVKAWADNAMLHVSVDDAKACHAQIAEIIASGRFPGARVAEPKHEPYGALVTFVWDPTGVLLHFAQWLNP